MNESLELVVHVRAQGQERLDAIARSIGGLSQTAQRAGGGLERLTGAISRAASEMDVLGASISRLPAPLQSVLQTIGPLGVGLGAAAGAAIAAGGAMLQMAKSAASLAEYESNMAERTGLTIRQFGQFSQAAKDAGVNAEAFTAAARTLSRALSANDDEGKKARAALADLGITARNQFGGLKDTATLWLEIADALQRVDDPARRARVVTDLFGRGGLELLPLFRDNLRETIRELEKLGFGFDEHGAAAAKRFDKALDDLGTRIDHIKRKIGTWAAENILLAIGDEEMQRRRSERRWSMVESLAWTYGGDLSQPPSDIRAAVARMMPKAPSSEDLRFSIEARRQAEEEAREAANKAAEKLRARERQFQALIDALDQQGLDPLARLIAATTARLRELAADGPIGRAEAARVQEALQAAIRRRLASQRLEPQAVQPTEMMFLWQQMPTLPATVRVNEEVTAAQLAAARERVVAALRRQVQFQTRLIELTAGPGGERAAIDAIAAAREEAARREFAITQDRAKLEADLDEARKGRILAIAELQKRTLDEYREAAGRVFDAMTASGSGGLRAFLLGQLRLQERAVFQNLATGLFQSIGGTLGGVGKSLPGWLTRGTWFDPRNVVDKAMAQQEIISRDRNTMAIDNLTATIQAAAASGGIAAGASGIAGVAADGSTVAAAGGGTAAAKTGLKGWQRGLGIAAVAAGGAAGIYAGLQEGGARGAVTATGSAAGAAGAILSLAGVSGPAAPILMGVGLALGFVRSLFPDPKRQRDEEISRILERARFQEPVSIERSVDIATGASFDYDYRGHARVVQRQNITVQISAMDAKSFLDRAHDIGLAVRKALQDGNPLAWQIAQTVGANT